MLNINHSLKTLQELGYSFKYKNNNIFIKPSKSIKINKEKKQLLNKNMNLIKKNKMQVIRLLKEKEKNKLKKIALNHKFLIFDEDELYYKRINYSTHLIIQKINDNWILYRQKYYNDEYQRKVLLKSNNMQLLFKRAKNYELFIKSL